MSRRQHLAATADTHWTIDKRIPAALIITILLQSAAAIWWAAGVSNTLLAQAQRQDRLEQTLKEQANEIKRLPTLDSEVKALQRSVEKLDKTIEKAIERLSPLGARR